MHLCWIFIDKMSELESISEQAIFAAGVECVRRRAMAATATIQVREYAGAVRQQAAVAALQRLAKGLRS